MKAKRLLHAGRDLAWRAQAMMRLAFEPLRWLERLLHRLKERKEPPLIPKPLRQVPGQARES